MNFLLQELYERGVIESFDTLEGSRGGGVWYIITPRGGDNSFIISEGGASYSMVSTNEGCKV